MALPSHSLWLVPDRSGPVFARLRSVIEALARRFDTPSFDPHVTVLGGLDRPLAGLEADCVRLAAPIEPYEIALGEIVSNGVYFQRLIALAAPTAAVRAAHEAAKAALAVGAGPYLPHLSIAYGDLDADETAELASAAAAAGVSGTHFTAATLELWRTDGPVEGWSRAGAFARGTARAR